MCVNCFTLKARRGFFCQNQQWVSKPSRFPGTQRLTQSRDSPSGSSKLGTSLSAFISGVWEPVVGRVGRGACRWKSGGKVKYYGSFHFFGKGLGHSHPFLCPSLLAAAIVLIGEACQHCRPIDSCTVNQS